MMGLAVRGTRVLLVAVMAAQLCARRAAGDDAPVVRRQRLGVDVGVASAIGLVGLSYQLAPWRFLRLEAAAGWGPTGVQLSVMPKLSLGAGRCSFLAGFGPSLAVWGRQAEAGHGPDPDVIPWLNLDLAGIECRTPDGISVQAAVGLTTPLVDYHWDFAELGDTIRAWTLIPQGRVGVGWWL